MDKKNWTGNWQQQGDVKFHEINEIPKDAKKLNHLIVMHGESGHTHQVIEKTGELYEKDGVLYLKVLDTNNGAAIKHEEHNTKVIIDGKVVHMPLYIKKDCEISRLVEYDPFEDVIRPLAE